MNNETKPAAGTQGGAGVCAPGAAAPAPARPRRRWRRRLLRAGILLAVLVIFHVPLLRFLAGLLVVDDPLAPADAVVVLGSNGPFVAVPFDHLAELYHQGLARGILLLEDRSSRIVQAEILPTLETVVRRELVARQVPEKALTTRAGAYHSAWDSAHSLRGWLEEHPHARAIVLCEQFDSRRSANIGRVVLGTSLAERVRWRALPVQRYDTSNWWRSRQGIMAVLGAYVALLHTYVVGEPSKGAERWNPDAFEKKLLEQSR